MPLAILFLGLALICFLFAMAGHAAKSNSAAPSMVTNNVSPIAWTGFAFCLFLALCAYAGVSS